MPPRADVIIRDSPIDTGFEPSPDPVFYASEDIWVRNVDDGQTGNQPAIRNQKNFVYVRVTNNGPALATDVKVSVRAAAFVGTEFVYPQDWTAMDALHVKATGIDDQMPKLAYGEMFLARFRLSDPDVDKLYGWEQVNWHPCILAEVTSPDDLGTFSGAHVWQSNNLAQRNITTVAKLQPFSQPLDYAFIAGSQFNREPHMEIVVDRSRMPRSAELLLDPSDSRLIFPALGDAAIHRNGRTVTKVLDRTRLAVSQCGSDSILTLEPGSSFEWSAADCADTLVLSGGEWVQRDGRRMIAIHGEKAVIGVPKAPGEMRQMSLRVGLPETDRKPFEVRITQRNIRGHVVGGVMLRSE